MRLVCGLLSRAREATRRRSGSIHTRNEVNPGPPPQSPPTWSDAAARASLYFPVQGGSREMASTFAVLPLPLKKHRAWKVPEEAGTQAHPPTHTPRKASLARLPDLRPLAVMLHGARRNCKPPRGRIPTINVAAKYCKTPNSPICVLPPKRENSLHRHSLIWQANSKPYWQSQACFPNQTAMEPKIALPVIC